MENNIILTKTYTFAIRIVNLYKYLTQEKKEFILAKQILRSGTSIGANTEEAIGGQSSSDFIAKMAIAYKEARETRFWIKLLRDTGYIATNQAESLFNDCEEILKIIGKIRSTSKKKKNP